MVHGMRRERRVGNSVDYEYIYRISDILALGRGKEDHHVPLSITVTFFQLFVNKLNNYKGRLFAIYSEHTNAYVSTLNDKCVETTGPIGRSLHEACL